MAKLVGVALAVVVAGVMAAALPAPAVADHQAGCAGGMPELDQAFSAAPGSGDYDWTPYAYRVSDGVGGVALAQTLTVGRSGTLLTISLLLHGRDITGPLPVEVRAGGPDGALLAVGSMSKADLVPGGWVEIALDSAPAVRAGDRIAIVLPALAPTHDGDTSARHPLVFWTTSPEDPGYPGGGSWAGDRYGMDEGVSTWGEYPNDRHFRTWVCGVPDTATLGTSVGSGRGPATDALRTLILAAAAVLGAALGVRAVPSRRRTIATSAWRPARYDLPDADPANPRGAGRRAHGRHVDSQREPGL